MKRKLFSALLFGACLMASTSTFVSCKDYDDDIQNLQTQIDANSKAIAEIQKLIQSGSVITNVSSTANGVTVTLSNGSTFNVTNGKDGVDGAPGKDGAPGTVITLGDNGNWFIDGKDSGMAAQGPKGDKGDKGDDGADAAVKGEWYALSADCSTLEFYKDGVKDPTKSIVIADLIEGGVVSAALTDDVLVLYNVAGSKDPVMIALNSTLHCLVFKPEFYLMGIEAMAAYTVKYEEDTLTTASPATAPLATGEVWGEKDTPSYVSPLVVARYHMNPSYFDVKKIKSIGFVFDDKTYLTRAEAGLDPEATAWEGEDNGILAVKIKMNAEKIADWTNATDSKVTVLAAQVKLGNDSIVTSDYAALTKTDINDVVVADKSIAVQTGCVVTPAHFHVYTSAADAIGEDPTHKLVWNAAEATDLNDFVVAHMKVGDEEREIAPANVKDYGMKFEYAASHYKSGSNNTSESVHMDIQGSKVKACMPNADGTAADPSNQNEASIGRMPMVRVILRDTVNNKVVALGFIKFKISRDDATADDIVREFGNPNGHELCCTGYEKKLTWTEVEHEVLSYLHLSKAEFETRYALVVANNECTQYYKKADGTWAVATDPVKTGTVVNVPNDEGHQTSVLKWTIRDTEVYDSVYDATAGAYKNDVELTTTVKFKPKDNYQSLPAVYVTFNSGKISTPSATWGNANKIKENWAAKNGAMGSGYVEIHNNVEVVGQTDANCEFKNDILNTLNGNKVTLGEINGSESFAGENADTIFTFKFIIKDYSELTGASGQVYTMSVANDGKTLQAVKKDVANDAAQAVAVLSTPNGATNNVKNNIIEYKKTDYALDILNAAGHKDLANTASATIGLFAENGCEMVLPIADNTFDVKFLRPLDVAGAAAKEFTDAVDGGNVLKLGELAVFNDWRDQWFCGDATHKCYYSYYGVSKIDPDLDNVTTTLNGGTLGTTKLSDVNPNLSLTEDVKTVNSYATQGTHNATHNYGTLTYNNNGQNTAAFKLRVPLKITYKWGVIDAYVDINVAATHNQ